MTREHAAPGILLAAWGRGSGLAAALLLSGGTLLLGACGGQDRGDEAARAGPPRVGDTIPLVRTAGEGREVPWLAVPDLSGDTVTVEDLRGSPVLINLWATWCPPCRKEIPYLQSLHERYDGRLRTVGISVDDRGAADQVRRFLDEADVTYQNLLDPSMRSMDLFGLVGLPGTFVADSAGEVVFARIGPVMEGDPELEGALEALLGSPTSPGEGAGR